MTSSVAPRRSVVQSLLALCMTGCLAACASSGPATVGPEPAAPAPAPRHGREPPPPAPKLTATPNLTAKQRMRLALELLSKGDAEHARPEIEAFMLEKPDNDLAKSLLAQIDQDPKTLLGAQSFSYTVQPGETLSILADRFLDDRFKFYALARYNNIQVPSQAEVGRVIQIPGEAPKPAKAKPSRRSDDEEIQDRLDRRAAPPPKPPAPRAPAPPERDPARASQLRGSALELMSKGLIDQAVRLLRQALALDPGNAVIQRDLDRALRILSGVRR